MSIIRVKVAANSKSESIEGGRDEGYTAKIKAKPKNGRANEQLIKLFKKTLGIRVKIVKGHRSQDKVLQIIE